jgi:hypothetical protein
MKIDNNLFRPHDKATESVMWTQSNHIEPVVTDFRDNFERSRGTEEWLLYFFT